jgi:hypothetical protein
MFCPRVPAIQSGTGLFLFREELPGFGEMMPELKAEDVQKAYIRPG